MTAVAHVLRRTDCLEATIVTHVAKLSACQDPSTSTFGSKPVAYWGCVCLDGGNRGLVIVRELQTRPNSHLPARDAS